MIKNPPKGSEARNVGMYPMVGGGRKTAKSDKSAPKEHELMIATLNDQLKGLHTQISDLTQENGDLRQSCLGLALEVKERVRIQTKMPDAPKINPHKYELPWVIVKNEIENTVKRDLDTLERALKASEDKVNR